MSITAAFYKRGSRGINIELEERNFNALAMSSPHDVSCWDRRHGRCALLPSRQQMLRSYSKDFEAPCRPSGIPSFLNGPDFGAFPRFGPTWSAQIGRLAQ
jgi:hypothetical protein